MFSLAPALLFSTGGCHNLSFGYECFLFIVWVSVLFVHLWRFLSFSSHCFMGLISPWPIPSLWGRREGGIPTPFCFALYTRIVKPLLQVVYFIQFGSIVDCVFSTGLLNEQISSLPVPYIRNIFYMFPGLALSSIAHTQSHALCSISPQLAFVFYSQVIACTYSSIVKRH